MFTNNSVFTLDAMVSEKMTQSELEMITGDLLKRAKPKAIPAVIEGRGGLEGHHEQE